MYSVKVLVVEDDPAARDVLVKFVRKVGFNAVEADDVLSGIRKIDEEKPDILISDYKMPNGDGLDVVRHLKKTMAASQAILVTAFGTADTAIMALREGVIDYLKKPIDLDELELALGRAQEVVLERKQIQMPPVILLAEDDEKTRKFLGNTLQKGLWEVVVAEDGLKASEIFKQRKIDVVILDINMPNLNGLECLHKMRGVSKDFEAIMVTGYGDEDNVMNVLKMINDYGSPEGNVISAVKGGAISYLKKPVDIEQMEMLIHKAVTELTLKRAIKYRMREIELANNIISRVIVSKGVVIDFIGPDKGLTSNMALGILDLVPMGILVVGKDRDILYANRPIRAAIGESGKKFDEDLVGSLEKIGIAKSYTEQILAGFKNFLDKKEGEIRTIELGKWAYITLIKLLILKDGQQVEAVLVSVRGERNLK